MEDPAKTDAGMIAVPTKPADQHGRNAWHLFTSFSGNSLRGTLPEESV
jgi:hypothetical protein